MNAILSEKVESTDMDSNLVTVSEVEAGIRDFVRKDVAHLRRPASGGSTEREPSAEATVNNVNSLIQCIAGTSLSQVETLVSELESLRDLLHAEGQRVPSRDEIHAHDRRQYRAVETHGRRPS